MIFFLRKLPIINEMGMLPFLVLVWDAVKLLNSFLISAFWPLNCLPWGLIVAFETGTCYLTTGCSNWGVFSFSLNLLLSCELKVTNVMLFRVYFSCDSTLPSSRLVFRICSKISLLSVKFLLADSEDYFLLSRRIGWLFCYSLSLFFFWYLKNSVFIADLF